MTFTSEDKRRIVDRISSINNDEQYSQVCKIFFDDKKLKYKNKNEEISLDLNRVSNKTLNKVQLYLDSIEYKEFKIIKNKTEKEKRVYKLSNYERNILNQRNKKKAKLKNELA